MTARAESYSQGTPATGLPISLALTLLSLSLLSPFDTILAEANRIQRKCSRAYVYVYTTRVCNVYMHLCAMRARATGVRERVVAAPFEAPFCPRCTLPQRRWKSVAERMREIAAAEDRRSRDEPPAKSIPILVEVRAGYLPGSQNPGTPTRALWDSEWTPCDRLAPRTAGRNSGTTHIPEFHFLSFSHTDFLGPPASTVLLYRRRDIANCFSTSLYPTYVAIEYRDIILPLHC